MNNDNTNNLSSDNIPNDKVNDSSKEVMNNAFTHLIVKSNSKSNKNNNIQNDKDDDDDDYSVKSEKSDKNMKYKNLNKNVRSVGANRKS